MGGKIYYTYTKNNFKKPMSRNLSRPNFRNYLFKNIIIDFNLSLTNFKEFNLSRLNLFLI
jgi:hypothetical protein